MGKNVVEIHLKLELKEEINEKKVFVTFKKIIFTWNDQKPLRKNLVADEISKENE